MSDSRDPRKITSKQVSVKTLILFIPLSYVIEPLQRRMINIARIRMKTPVKLMITIWEVAI